MTRIVALVLGLALVLSAGGFGAAVILDAVRDRAGSSAPPSSDPDPGATEAPRAALERFYSQELEWEPCRDDYWCATLTVPLDYQRPGGFTLDLAVLAVPARETNHRLGAIVVNPGGPGASGVDYAASARQIFGSSVLERYNVVGFDPRGTGDSAPVDCLTDDQLDAYVAEDPTPDTPAEVRAYERSVQAFGRGCVRRSGQLAGHVSTVEAARDLDILRAALGDSTLTYYGASYGTKLGATYAELFPDRVGRLVLDGAVDVGLDSRELSRQQAAGFETALRAYVADCVDDGDCPLGDDVDAGVARIAALLAAIEVKSLPAGGDRTLAIGNAFYGLILPLYNSDTWSYLSEALSLALDGDGSLLMRFSDLYHSRTARGYSDNSTEANYAINCLDDPWAISSAEVPEHLPDFEEASPTFGRIFAWGLTGCAGVRVEAAEPAPEIRAAGAAPIVVIGTTRDPATPYAWAEALAGQLESGVLLTRDGDGHTGYRAGNDCIDEAVEAYLLEGTVPADGQTC